MKATSPRRQLIVIMLLVLAVLGAGVRWWAPKPSLARDVGTLLLVLWLPVIGNLIAFVIARVANRRRRAFAPDAPFAPHMRAELTAAGGRLRLEAGECRCLVVVGTEAFTARLPVPLAQWLTGSQPQAQALEFLRPEIALPHLAPGTRFSVLAGSSVIGSGRVAELAIASRG